MASRFFKDRVVAVCEGCGKRYASNDGWTWVCVACGSDATAQALVEIAGQLVVATAPAVRWRTCPVDGCLLLPGEACPACRARDLDLGGHYRRYRYSETEHDPKRPIAWRPNGRGIQVAVYEQSEVA